MLAKLWGKRIKQPLGGVWFFSACTNTSPTAPEAGRAAPGWARHRGCSSSPHPPPPRGKSKAHFAGSTRARPGLGASVIASGAAKPIGKAGLGEALGHQTRVQSPRVPPWGRWGPSVGSLGEQFGVCPPAWLLSAETPPDPSRTAASRSGTNIDLDAEMGLRRAFCLLAGFHSG